MNKIALLSLALSSALLLGACTATGEHADALPGLVAAVPQIAAGGYQGQPQVLPVDGKISLLYVNGKGQIMFQRGSRQTQVDAGLNDKGQQFLNLNVAGRHVAVTWWTHDLGKKIYLATSSDAGQTFSKPLIVTPTDAQPLAPISLITNAKGQPAAVIYKDERTQANQIREVRFDAASGQWRRTDTQLDTGPLAEAPNGAHAHMRYDVLLQNGEKLLLAWISEYDTAAGKRFRLVSRASDNLGATWGTPVLVYEGAAGPTNLAGTSTADGFALAYQPQGKPLELASCQNVCSQWAHSEGLKNTDLNINSGLVMKAGVKDTADRVFLSWIAQKQIGKPWIQIGVYDLKSAAWLGAAQRLDVKSVENTQSVMPSIAVNSKGVPLVAWEDYRNILPNVYISGSFDGGKTWTVPANTQRDGVEPGIVAALTSDHQDYILQYQTYEAGRNQAPVELVVRKMSPQPPNGFGPVPASKPVVAQVKSAALSEQVKTFWAARKAAKWDETYSMFDPTYRSMLTPKEFERQQVFKYDSAKIVHSSIDGNVAKVALDVVFEVPSTVVFGHKIEQQKRDARIDQTWLWIADQWYLQADAPVTHTGFIKY
jgi:hypothetical protein